MHRVDRSQFALNKSTMKESEREICLLLRLWNIVIQSFSTLTLLICTVMQLFFHHSIASAAINMKDRFHYKSQLNAEVVKHQVSSSFFFLSVLMTFSVEKQFRSMQRGEKWIFNKSSRMKTGSSAKKWINLFRSFAFPFSLILSFSVSDIQKHFEAFLCCIYAMSC